MRKMFVPAVLTVIVLQGLACSPDGNDPLDTIDSGQGVSLGEAGMGSPGDPSLGGLEGGTLSGGGAADAGPGGSTGALDAGSTPDGGAAGAMADAGSRDDSGPGMAQGDSDGGNVGAKPSAGCGKSGRPTGGRVSVQSDHNYTFPTTYDGTRPFPLLIGFHAAGNPIDQIERLTMGSDFETNFVRAFPKSMGSAWNYGEDIGRVKAMYDDLMANYCLDMNRVFATGHSSGAQLIVQILTPANKADADHLKFTGVAPVAASRYGTVSRAIPVLYIQAQLDTVRNSSGSDVVKEFVTANGCMMTTKPYAATPSCMSSGKTVKNGCVQYDGCKVPTVWCSHDDPQYGTSFHGWPCFATKTMYDFFKSLP